MTPADSIGHIRSRADRDPDVGASERRRVVHAVANHRDLKPAALELRDGSVFVFWEHIGEHFIHADIGANRLGDLTSIPSDHHDAETIVMQESHRLDRLRADLVLQRDRADHVVAFRTKSTDASPLTPLRQVPSELNRFGELPLAEERRTAHRDGVAIDVRNDPSARQRSEP